MCVCVCVYIYIYIRLFSISLLQDTEFSFLCSTIGPCLSFLYIVVCIWSEKAMAPHSSTLVWKIPWMEDPGSLRVGQTERLHFHFSLSCFGEGNGNPLQGSFLENPRDERACWAAIYGVAQSQQ